MFHAAFSRHVQAGLNSGILNRDWFSLQSEEQISLTWIWLAFLSQPWSSMRGNLKVHNSLPSRNCWKCMWRK